MPMNWRGKIVDATTRLLFSLMPTKVEGKDKTKAPCAQIILSAWTQVRTFMNNPFYFLLTSPFAVRMSF